MKNILSLGVTITLLATSALAIGPNTIGGQSVSPNLVSRNKITAVLNAITEAGAVVESVRHEGGLQYVVSIRSGNACSESQYQVQSMPNQPGKYRASFVDLVSSGPCQ